MKEHERHNRNKNIVCEVIEGKTMVEVSVEFGLSVGRIRQICNRYLRRVGKRRHVDTTVWNARKEKDMLIEIIKAL